MKPSPKSIAASLAFAFLVTLAFAGGYLAARYVALTHPPAFEVTELKNEIPLIRFTRFSNQTLEGKYEGAQPRFLLGADEALVVPEKDGSFKLDLKKVK